MSESERDAQGGETAVDTAYLQALADYVGSSLEETRSVYFNPESPWMLRGLREHPWYVWFSKGWSASDLR